MKIFGTLALAVCLAASGPTGALADKPDKDKPAKPAAESDTTKAKKSFAKAQKLFALGRFKQALAEYENAYEAKSLPEFLFNIGQCHRNLGNYKSAIFSFRKYLKLKPDAKNRKAVKKLIRELEDEIAEAEAQRKRESELERERERERELERERERERDLVKTPPPDDGKRAKKGAFYTRWWFWTGVAVVAAGGTAAVFVVGSDSGIPSSDLGNVDFAR